MTTRLTEKTCLSGSLNFFFVVSPRTGLCSQWIEWHYLENSRVSQAGFAAAKCFCDIDIIVALAKPLLLVDTDIKARFCSLFSLYRQSQYLPLWVHPCSHKYVSAQGLENVDRLMGLKNSANIQNLATKEKEVYSIVVLVEFVERIKSWVLPAIMSFVTKDRCTIQLEPDST